MNKDYKFNVNIERFVRRLCWSSRKTGQVVTNEFDCLK